MSLDAPLADEADEPGAPVEEWGDEEEAATWARAERQMAGA